MYVVEYQALGKRQRAYFLLRKEAERFRNLKSYDFGTNPVMYWDEDIEVQPWERSIQEKHKDGSININ